jgi:hypothetical protein
VALTIGIVVLRSLPASDRVADAKAGDSPQGKLWGYDVGYVEHYWGSLKDARISERKLLLVDLAFPLLYGGAFAMVVLFAWSILGFHPAWLLALLAAVLIGVAADWTENLVLLAQLGQFEKTGSSSAGWIRLASTATTLKWAFVGVSLIETVVLAIAVGRQT